MFKPFHIKTFEKTILYLKYEILAKSQNEHKPEKGLAPIPHEANNYFAHTIITKISGISDKP